MAGAVTEASWGESVHRVRPTQAPSGTDWVSAHPSGHKGRGLTGSFHFASLSSRTRGKGQKLRSDSEILG